MSDSSNHELTPSSGSDRNNEAADTKSLAHVESPSIAPEGAESAPRADLSEPATPYGRPDPRTEPKGSANARGTALILAPTRAEAPKAGPIPSEPPPAPRSKWIATMVVAAAVLGGIAGSLATASISQLAASQEAPPYYTALSDALGRLDRELSTLKTGAETSARAAGQQVARMTERLDRTEKTQADTGTKLAKASEAVDRLERRLAAPTAGDVTGAIGEPHPAAAPLQPGPFAPGDTRRLPPGPIVDGWVVRDVFNGSAMIQNRAGVVQVLPGDSLPGLGRIEQVRRQDGRWIVVTSRGLIVSR